VTVPVLFAPPVSVPGFSVIEASAATEVVSRVVVAVAVPLGVAVAVAGESVSPWLLALVSELRSR
jgi:hypothetical protein